MHRVKGRPTKSANGSMTFRGPPKKIWSPQTDFFLTSLLMEGRKEHKGEMGFPPEAGKTIGSSGFVWGFFTEACDGVNREDQATKVGRLGVTE